MLNCLDNIKTEILKEIEELAAVFHSPKEVALMLEIEEAKMQEWMEAQDNEVYRSFQKGRLQSEFELRKSIVRLAKSGSSPAQAMALDMLKQSKLKMID